MKASPREISLRRVLKWEHRQIAVATTSNSIVQPSAHGFQRPRRSRRQSKKSANQTRVWADRSRLQSEPDMRANTRPILRTRLDGRYLEAQGHLQKALPIKSQRSLFKSPSA